MGGGRGKRAAEMEPGHGKVSVLEHTWVIGPQNTHSCFFPLPMSHQLQPNT